MIRYIYILLFVVGIIGFYSVSFAQIGIECNARVKCVCESNSVRVVPCPDPVIVNTAIDCANQNIPEGTCEVDCGQEVGALCEEIPIECRNNETANCIVTLPVEVGISGSGCAPGETQCSGNCVDTDTHNANCGECGNACDPGEICVDSQCLLTDV